MITRAFGWIAGAAALFSTASAQLEPARFDSSAFSLGTLTPSGGAMSRTLWEGADNETVSALLTAVPVSYDDPLHLEVLRRVLLSPGDGPAGSDNALAGQKFLTAARAGFYRDAASLAELVPGLRSEPALAQVLAYSELFEGQSDTACARGAGLRDGRTASFWVKLRFYCYVRAEEVSAAELTLNLLGRQSVLSAEEYTLFSDFLAGIGNSALPNDVFSYAMAREQNRQYTLEDLGFLTSAIVAAIARDGTQDPAVRERALVQSLVNRTIDAEEGWMVLDQLTSSQLAADLIGVQAQFGGSVEQSIAVGEALTAARGDWSGFTARSILLADALGATDPVINFAPNADVVALAAMINGQTDVVERWIVALAGDETDPTARPRASTLLEVYAARDPGAARRVGSYVGMGIEVSDPATFDVLGPLAALSVSELVSAGLQAAEAGSEGPATLVYLMGLGVAPAEETQTIQHAVLNWARDRANLDWLDRQAAFRGAAVAFMEDGGFETPVVIPGGQPVPRLKPENE